MSVSQMYPRTLPESTDLLSRHPNISTISFIFFLGDILPEPQSACWICCFLRMLPHYCQYYSVDVFGDTVLPTGASQVSLW